MSLRVICHVYQQPAHGRRQQLCTNRPRLLQTIRINLPDARSSAQPSSIQFRK
jgi:hypothetical protein